MRLKIEFTSNGELLPVNNQHLVNSFIHTVIGRNNEYHDSKSNYCISTLCGGKLYGENMLKFEKDPFIIVTSDDSEFLNKVIMGLMSNVEFGHGIKFKNFSFITEEFYNGWNHFLTLSPILIKDRIDGNKTRFVTIDDSNYQEVLKNHIIRKLSKIDPNLDLLGFDLVLGDKVRKVKKVLVKNVLNRASVVQVSIKTNKKVAEKLYNLGLGQSTGCGFGTIYKAENYEKFKW